MGVPGKAPRLTLLYLQETAQSSPEPPVPGRSKLNTADSKSAELAKRVTRAESKSHGGPSDLKGKSCFICGGDHLAKACTQKKGHKGNGGKETEIIDVTDDE